eukprot:6378172-Prymnesium_polylepis.2
MGVTDCTALRRLKSPLLLFTLAQPPSRSPLFAIVTGEAEAIVNGVSRRETALAGGGEHRG